MAKRRRIPRQIWPLAIERAYRKQLLERVAAMRVYVEHYIEAIKPLVASNAVQLDSDADRLRDLTKSLREFMRNAGPGLDPTTTARKVAAYQSAQLRRQFAALNITPRIIDTKLPKRIEAFAAGNTQLIESLATEAADRIAKIVAREFQKGTRHEEIATQMRESLGVAESRAKVIARDQVGSLYGQVNADRQKSAGVRGFIWRTVGDNRVRDDHEARNGQSYSYSDPPEGELPGEPILCRCYAEPDLSTLGDE